MKTNIKQRVFLLPTICLFLLLSSVARVSAAFPQIASISNDSASVGTVYSKIPTLVAGANVKWTKEYGPDDLTVDPTTGMVSWTIPAGQPREAFHLGVRATNSDGSVYTTWILKVGGGNYIYVGAGETYTTISAGTAAASSGDTIVVRDGVYAGVVNMMINNTTGDRGTMPPSGSTGVYTTIMAEHPGGAQIDGEGVRNPIHWNGNYDSRDGQAHFTYNTAYIALKGFIVSRAVSGGPLFMNHVRNIKIIDVGAYDQATGDSGAVINIARSGYILIEGCYTWGNGREGIMIYICDNSIMRRNIVRIDRTNAPEPMAGIVNYASQYARTQNSIVIDSDQFNYYTYSYLAGAYCDSSGGARYEAFAKIIDVNTVSSIALNVNNAFTVNVQNDNGSEPTRLDNMIGWDVKVMSAGAAGGGGSPYPVINAPGDMLINQSTFGRISSPFALIDQGVFLSGWAGTQAMSNSILYDFKDYGNVAGGLFNGWESADFNNIFGTGTINKYNSTITNTITSDPTTACLKYLPRIEAGCSLQTAGLSSARVGANILYMRGKSGTLFGEPGYDTEGTTPMWPYPHEELIKSKMAAYSYDNGNLTGARGFAAPGQTLTNYIWGYLGNTVPPFNLAATPATNTSLTLNWSPNTANANITGYKVYVGTSPGVYNAGKSVTTTTDTIPGLTANVPYYIAVTAVDSVKGESGYSYEIIATPLDTTPPVVSFTLPTSSNTRQPSFFFSATDNIAVTGYMVTESPTTPASDAAGWSSSAPISYTFTSDGNKTLYPWAKDAAGIVSIPLDPPKTIIIDTTPPEITFTAPAYSKSLEVTGITLTATDVTSAVAGYLVNENAVAPTADAVNQTLAQTASYTFTTEGTKTLYAWAKDSLGNVSFGKSTTIIIDLTPPTLDLTPPTPTILSSQTLSGTVTDNNPGTTVTVKVGDAAAAPATLSGSNWSYPAANFGVGAKTIPITVTAQDAAGNVTVATGNIIKLLAGDIDGNGTVDVGDALLAMKSGVGKVTFTGDAKVRGDVGPVNGGVQVPNGSVDTGDAVVILGIAVGLYSF